MLILVGIIGISLYEFIYNGGTVDFYKILNDELTKDYVIFLNYLIDGVENNEFNQLKFEDKLTYNVVNIPNFVKATSEIVITSDNMLRKAKVLETKGYIKIKMGKFNDSKCGYTRTAIAINKKAYELLR